MFVNHNVPYACNEENLGDSFSLCSSSNSSFSSDGSSSSWEYEMVMTTPTSTPRKGSPGLLKVERTPSQTSTPSHSPTRSETHASFCATTSMTQDMIASFDDSGFIFPADGNMVSEQTMADYHNFNSYNSLVTGLSNGTENHLICDTFQTNSGLTLEPPALDIDLYSPESGIGSSPASEDFVIPSETTFINNFDLQSPMAPVKSLHFDLSYESPLSEYDPNFALEDVSDAGCMSYYQPSTYGPKSASTTPSRFSSLRQSIFKPLPTTAALQHIQSIKGEDQVRDRYRDVKRQHSPTSPIRHKSIKRESKDLILSGNIRMIRPARRECTFEGCKGKFQRLEHLKRHEKIHWEDVEMFKCKFCTKTFGRNDNLKSHVALHTQPDGTKKSRRTAYHPDALAEWQRMDQKRGKGRTTTGDGEGRRVKDEEGRKPSRLRITGY
ncbi:hypothetical protein EG329_012361 [Mollisiaceae sp. DMI_Dod_QoI]|nr:hypothetical protein EG329_012361 [Helotiales sp. DMI_Dod_QoI]